MRQANFPDQETLTARDEMRSELNQPTWAGSLTAVQFEQPEDKVNTKKKALRSS